MHSESAQDASAEGGPPLGRVHAACRRLSIRDNPRLLDDAAVQAANVILDLLVRCYYCFRVRTSRAFAATQ